MATYAIFLSYLRVLGCFIYFVGEFLLDRLQSPFFGALVVLLLLQLDDKEGRLVTNQIVKTVFYAWMCVIGRKSRETWTSNTNPLLLVSPTRWSCCPPAFSTASYWLFPSSFFCWMTSSE